VVIIRLGKFRYNHVELLLQARPPRALNISKNKQADLFVVEVKKPFGNVYNQYESDYVQLQREMKLILDTQIELGLDTPVSYGMLVDGE
jgi:hypothetical protein